MIKLNL